MARGKKEKNKVLHNEDPLAGLPDIIGRPKDASNYSSPSTNAQSKVESTLSTTDNFDKRNEGTPKVYKIPQEGPEVAEKTLPDWKEEEEEMGRYAAYGTEDGFATGVTFDELATVGKILSRRALEPSEEKTAADIVSKIDGTELLGLLESKIGDTSKKIALLLDRGIAGKSAEGSSLLRNDSEEGFNIHDYS
jgi:hypothetical protein